MGNVYTVNKNIYTHPQIVVVNDEKKVNMFRIILKEKGIY